MRLNTLGGLGLEGSSFKKQKPLLLLAYLALEGTTPRDHLSELFYMEAKDPLNSLSSALSQLRRASKELFGADHSKVWLEAGCDATDFLAHADAQRFEKCAELYGGAFLLDLRLELSWELEEWVLKTREYLAGRMREALLQLAEGALQRGEVAAVGPLAEQAFDLHSAGEPEPDAFQRIYSYLSLANNPKSIKVREEAEEYGLTLSEPEPLSRQSPAADLKEEGIPTNLPIAKTSFIGRDQALIDIATQLNNPSCRLITLHGMGGIGKTRLALQVARDQLSQAHFKDGVYFVTLEAVSSPDLIPSSLANALKLELQDQGDVTGQVTRYIGDKSILLVLDNFEHLTEASPLLSEILQACPNLKLLVTSRETLKLEEEWVKGLEGLHYPDTVNDLSLEESHYYEAINLFMQRAKRSNLNFKLSQSDLGPLLELCQLTQGLPLALELTAAWVPVMTLDEITQELQKNLSLFESSSRNLPERHQSVQAALNTSWAKLTQGEQAALSQLAVFEGGFTRVAASQVTGTSLPTLLSLVSKSLVSTQSNGRFDMHPLVHSFAKDKLPEREERNAETQEAHADYYLDLARSLDYWGEGSVEAMKRFDTYKGNFRKAIGWSLTNKDLGELTGFEDIVTYYDRQTKLDEGINFFETALYSLVNQSTKSKILAGRLNVNAGWLYYRKRDLESAQQKAHTALDLAQETKDLETQMKAYNIIGWIYYHSDQFDIAINHFEQALHIATVTSNHTRHAMYLSNIGAVHVEKREYVLAKDVYEKALSIYEEQQSEYGQIPILMNLAKLYNLEGDFQKALRILDDVHNLINRLSYSSLIPHVNLLKIENYFDTGEFEKVISITHQVMTECSETLTQDLTSYFRAFLGRVALYRNRPEDAYRFCRSAYSLGDPISSRQNKMVLVLMAECFVSQGLFQEALLLTNYLSDLKSLQVKDADRIEKVQRQLEKSLPSSEYLSAKTYTEQHLESIIQDFLDQRRVQV